MNKINTVLERTENNFDFLRVLAAVLITYGHSFGLTANEENMPTLKIGTLNIQPLFIALSIFFTISGYLIAKSAYHSRSVKHYLWKRVLRIQPLLVVYCIVAVLGLAFISTLTPLQYFSSFKTWAYFQNIIPLFGYQSNLPGVFSENSTGNAVNGSLWSLVLEERLYFLGILLLVLNRNKKANWFIIATLFILIFYFINSRLLRVLLPINSSSIYYGITFMIGVSLYIFNFKGSVSNLVFLSVIWIVGIYFLNSFEALISLILLPAIIISFALIKTPLSNFAKHGDFTYGIFLFSFPVQQLLIYFFQNELNPYPLFFFTLPIAFVFSVLSWHLVEKRFLKLKDLV